MSLVVPGCAVTIEASRWPIDEKIVVSPDEK